MKANSGFLYTWDFLIWILVFFPLITGGVWVRHPGLFLELADLSVPVLIVSLLGALLVFWKKVDLSRASSIQLLLRLWRKWNDLLDHSAWTTLWVSAITVAATLAFAALRRHWAYGSGAADLGIFTNAIWNLTHGNGYISSLKDGINLFIDHQSPIFWLFAPLFKIFPHPETLLILQSLGISTGGVALYFIGRQYLGQQARAWAAALPLLYWMYLPIRNANSFDFHPEVMMLPLFLWGILGMQSTAPRARILGGLALLLGLGAKESAGPVAVGAGVAWILGAAPEQARSFCRKAGIILIVLGTGIFYIDTHLVPQSLGGAYAYNSNYAQFGGGISNIIFSPITRPDIFWPHVLGKARLKFLLWTLGPLSFLPLLGWRAFITALPGYAILFLSEGDHRVSLQYHYSTEPAIGLFWAMAPALLSISRLPPVWTRRIAWSMVFFSLVFFGRSEFFRARIESPTAHMSWLSHEMIPCLSQSSYAASGALVAHLATRPWIHHLPNLDMPQGRTVHCAVFDPAINNWPMAGDDWKNLDSNLADRGLKLIYSCDRLKVFQNKTNLENSQESCLKCQPACPPH